MARTAGAASEAVIIGAGIAAFTTALECAHLGISVTVIAADLPSAATQAAAGMLAPSIDAAPGAAGFFASAARDFYREFIPRLVRDSGVRIPFELNGIIALASAPENNHSADAEAITAAELRSLEPALAQHSGGLFYPDNGWVDNRLVLDALSQLVRNNPKIHFVPAEAVRLRIAGTSASVLTRDGREFTGERVVLAAGAWSMLLDGLPRTIPLDPVRGQMLAVAGLQLNHVVFGAGAYAVPRPHAVSFLGSSMERVGFDAGTTDKAIAGIRAAASEITGTFRELPEQSRWAGLRPITPDLLPVLGPDPLAPQLVYCLGHSRNGILLGPLTGKCIAELIRTGRCSLDISPFAPTRFEAHRSN